MDLAVFQDEYPIAGWENGFDFMDNVMGDDLSSPVQFAEQRVQIQTKEGLIRVYDIRELAIHSNYFKNLFLKGLTSLYRLPTITIDDLMECLSMAWTIENATLPNLSLDKCAELLVPAARLEMNEVLRVICEVIEAKVDYHTILPLFRLAREHFEPLATVLWEKILRNFSALFSEGICCDLTDDEMCMALNDDYIDLSPQDELTVITDYLSKHPDSPQVWEICNSLNKKLALAALSSTAEPVTYRERIPRELVLTLGGWSCHDSPVKGLEAFNPITERWHVVPDDITMLFKPVAYPSVSVCDDKLFVCGGMSRASNAVTGRLKTATVLDFNLQKWFRLPDMSVPRCYAASTPLYTSEGSCMGLVVGGVSTRERLASAEMLNFETCTWIPIQSMNLVRSDAACISVNNIPVVIGGYDGRAIHDTAEYMDLGTGRWYVIPRTMHRHRTGVAAVTLTENVFLVAGGFEGQYRLNSLELYDFREGVWHSLPEEMNTNRSNFGMEVMGGDIFMAGGYDGASTTWDAERYDIVARAFEPLPHLALPRSALRLARIENQALIRRILA